jgi:hypothetical protein
MKTLEQSKNIEKLVNASEVARQAGRPADTALVRLMEADVFPDFILKAGGREYGLYRESELPELIRIVQTKPKK